MSDQSNDRAPCFAVENGSYGTYDPRMPQRKVRIKIEHRIEYPDPLRVAAGERVNVGREDAEFPGWKWCKGCSQMKEQKRLCCRIIQRVSSPSAPERKLSSKKAGTSGCWCAMLWENVAGFPPQIQSRSRLTSIFAVESGRDSDEAAGVRGEDDRMINSHAVEACGSFAGGKFSAESGEVFTAKKCSHAQAKSFCNGASVPLTSALLYNLCRSPLGFIPLWNNQSSETPSFS